MPSHLQQKFVIIRKKMTSTDLIDFNKKSKIKKERYIKLRKMEILVLKDI